MPTGPQYTSCVAPKDFAPINPFYVGVLVVAGLASFAVVIMSAGLGLLLMSAVIIEALHYVLDWMLNGKLICLRRAPGHACNCGEDGAQVCAIGEVGDIENVGEDKNPIEDVDNDYAINLVLAPASHGQFAANKENSTEYVNDYTKDSVSDAARKNLKLAQDGPQGDLITVQDGMPEDDGKPKFVGYFRTFVMLTSTKEYHPWNELFGKNFKDPGGPDYQELWSDYLLAHAWQLPAIYSVPVLHCEFEGTRIRDMLAAIEQFEFGGKWCKKNFLFKILCKIIQSITAPLALAAVIKAWIDATGGSAADALADPEAGEVKIGQMVVLRGRWAYDGGHDGYNEVHAVRTLQRVGYVPTGAAEFNDFQNRWCEKLAEVPPPRPVDTGVHPVDMTPAQQTVDDNQRRPENRWEEHPAIDGCDPGGDRGTIAFKPPFPVGDPPIH
jgi:hypothetical protein